MVSFSSTDIIIIVTFFAVMVLIGFLPSIRKDDTAESYLLSGRKVGLFLFILTNVSTWYGGILGVGEFTYKFGLLSWFTQGLPYYIFAIVFAFFLAPKIRNASLFTIPDMLEARYGHLIGLLSSVLIFILVSPAPYILMVGSLLQLIFKTDLLTSIIIAALFSSIYLIKGGYKSDLYTDVFQFFIMFAGFIIIVIVSFKDVGDLNFLANNLPPDHLSLTGGASSFYILVWFLIALWTFADPGFHQRCYAAKDSSTAKWGIIISVLLWAVFDFLTTTTGLFSRALIPGLENPVMAFPLYAEKILSSGLKGIFYAALFATILSTSNSFLFLSATTFGRDLVFKQLKNREKADLILFTRIGILISAIVAILLAYTVQSVINLWFVVGSFCIPGIILLIFGAYYEKFKVGYKYAISEIIAAPLLSVIWYFIIDKIENQYLQLVEPMIAGLIAALIIHLAGLIKKERLN
ncbi:MAG TPA: sodium:solute symporter family protein [Melioribacteraceae bacterium]|nr:sodium:solute symporter family protein [Melioribacteraceae bacterium]